MLKLYQYDFFSVVSLVRRDNIAHTLSKARVTSIPVWRIHNLLLTIISKLNYVKDSKLEPRNTKRKQENILLTSKLGKMEQADDTKTSQFLSKLREQR